MLANAQVPGGGKDVRGNDLLLQAVKLAVGQMDAIEGLELLTEVVLQRRAVANVRAVAVFEIAQFFDQ